MNSHQKENILKNLQDKNIMFKEFKNYEDYINILELLKISSEFAVSINEITDKNKEYIIDLIKNYQNTKFLFLYNQNLSINQIYEIILNGAVDVLPLNTNPELITAKIIATFRSEFRKINLGIIKTKDNKITLDLDNLKITIEKKNIR